MSDLIPDPSEIMDGKIERMADSVFSGVPDGKARCLGCKGVFDIDDLIQATPNPDSGIGCAECLGVN